MPYTRARTPLNLAPSRTSPASNLTSGPGHLRQGIGSRRYLPGNPFKSTTCLSVNGYAAAQLSSHNTHLGVTRGESLDVRKIRSSSSTHCSAPPLMMDHEIHRSEASHAFFGCCVLLLGVVSHPEANSNKSEHALIHICTASQLAPRYLQAFGLAPVCKFIDGARSIDSLSDTRI